MSLNIACNHVVTQLEVYNNGVNIGRTTQTPTAANSFDSAFQPMLPPITLSPTGTAHNILILAFQPDGSSRQFSIQVDQQAEANPADCAYRCDSVKEVWACDRSYWVHRDYYQGHDPSKHVCYQCNTFMGFDPKNNCQGTVVGHRGQGGCFAEDTQILMGDGSKKRADAIRPGDEVFNPIVGRAIKVEKVIAGPENAELLAISIDTRTIKVSQEHPFMTELGPIPAHVLKVGDKILDIDGSYRSITKINALESLEPVKVWNFILQGEYQQLSHLLVGDGIVSGDLVLQKQPVDQNLIRFAFDIE
ncbi:MAG: Hint domain-containing protein [Oligoflexus sp.]